MSRKIKGVNSNIIHRITAVLNDNLEARNSEFLISNYILKNLDEVSQMGIEELAEHSYTSASTVSRFIKKLGYKNFLQFKRELIGYQEFRANEFQLSNYDNRAMIDCVLDKQICALEALRPMINLEQFENIARLIHDAKDVYVFGIDYSQIMAQDLQLRFVNNQKIINTYVPTTDFERVSNYITERSLVIFVSVSGNSASLRAIQEQLDPNINQVLITENYEAKLAENINEIVFLPDREIKLVATALTERQIILTVFDILYLVYANLFPEKR